MLCVRSVIFNMDHTTVANWPVSAITAVNAGKLDTIPIHICAITNQ